MRLADILMPQCVTVDLPCDDKKTAIFALVDMLVDCDAIGDISQLKQAVWEREETRTTGIGHGIAIPHGKIDSCNQLIMAVGKTVGPLDFGAIDGQPVQLIFLLASPADQTGPHIHALSAISHMLTDEDCRSAISNATASQAIYDIIIQHDAKALA